MVTEVYLNLNTTYSYMVSLLPRKITPPTHLGSKVDVGGSKW